MKPANDNERIPLSEIDPGDVYRPDQVASTFRYENNKAVMAAIKNGRLKAAKIGKRTYRIKGQWILDWQESLNTTLEKEVNQVKASQEGNGAPSGSRMENVISAVLR